MSFDSVAGSGSYLRILFCGNWTIFWGALNQKLNVSTKFSCLVNSFRARIIFVLDSLIFTEQLHSTKSAPLWIQGVMARTIFWCFIGIWMVQTWFWNFYESLPFSFPFTWFTSISSHDLHTICYCSTRHNFPSSENLINLSRNYLLVAFKSDHRKGTLMILRKF